MLVIAVIIAGRHLVLCRAGVPADVPGRLAPRDASSDRKGGGAGVAILIAIGLIAVAWVLSLVIRLALSRSRELLADAGSVELTKNPDAMISALRKIEGRGELAGRDLGGDGDVRRQSARGVRRPVRHPSADRRSASATSSSSPAATIPAPWPCRSRGAAERREAPDDQQQASRRPVPGATPATPAQARRCRRSCGRRSPASPGGGSAAADDPGPWGPHTRN